MNFTSHKAALRFLHAWTDHVLKVEVNGLTVHSAFNMCNEEVCWAFMQFLQDGVLTKPADGYHNPESQFQSWRKHPKYDALYQGGWNSR